MSQIRVCTGRGAITRRTRVRAPTQRVEAQLLERVLLPKWLKLSRATGFSGVLRPIESPYCLIGILLRRGRGADTAGKTLRMLSKGPRENIRAEQHVRAT